MEERTLTEVIRDLLKRSNEKQFFLENLPDLPARQALQKELIAFLPEADRYDVADDARFWRLILHVRMSIDARRAEDYESGMMDLARTIERAILGAGTSVPAQDPVPPADGVADAGDAGEPQAPGVPVAPMSVPGPSPELPDGLSRGTDRLLFRDERAGVIGFAPGLLLPAPPPAAPSRDLSAWLAGEMSDAMCFGVRLSQAAVEAMVIDSETEMLTDAEAFFARPGMSPRMMADVFPGYGDWVLERAQEEGLPDLSRGAFHRLRASLEAVIRREHPDRPARLHAAGAELVIGPRMAAILETADRLEALYLAETGEDGPHRPDQDLRGSFSPEGRLRRGDVMVRAASCHVLAGFPMAAAVTLALVEMRSAQVLRRTPEADRDTVFRDFDRMFFEDCRAPLDRYMICENELTPGP